MLRRDRLRQPLSRLWPTAGALLTMFVMGFSVGASLLPGAGSGISDESFAQLNAATCTTQPSPGWNDMNGVGARDNAMMAYDSALGEVVLFGGYNGAFLGDTWTFKGGCWTEYESATATAGQCTLISTGATVTCPAPSAQGAMGYDPSTPALILFPGNIGGTLSQQTWEFTSSGWTQLTCTATSCPPAQFDLGMATDPLDNQAMLFDGCTTSSTSCTGSDGALWAFHAGGWTQLCSGSTAAPACATEPAGRSSFGFAYDTADQRVVMFGGVPPGKVGKYDGDTWEVHGSTPGAVSWVQVCTGSTTAPQCSTEPAARGYLLLSDEARDGYALLFGGYDGSELADTWEFKGTTPGSGWTQCTSCSGPSARDGDGGQHMTYDYAAGDQYALLFGGVSGATYLGDTWIYN